MTVIIQHSESTYKWELPSLDHGYHHGTHSESLPSLEIRGVGDCAAMEQNTLISNS